MSKSLDNARRRRAKASRTPSRSATASSCRKGISNSYLVTTDDGDLLINTGHLLRGGGDQGRFAQVSTGPAAGRSCSRRATPTTSAAGRSSTRPGSRRSPRPTTPTCASTGADCSPSTRARTGKLWGRVMHTSTARTSRPSPWSRRRSSTATTFTLGGRRVELYSTPGGETTDSLVVWLPERSHACSREPDGSDVRPRAEPVHDPGRQDPQRHRLRPRALDRVMALAPEVLITGHGASAAPRRSAATMQQVRDATDVPARPDDRRDERGRRPLDADGADARCRPSSHIPQGHGKVPWIVRAIWEEHVGWFRYESTTELYDVPPSAVWADLVELAGGTAASPRGPAARRARRPLHALHFTDMVLAQSPGDAAALAGEARALEQLLAASGRENFSEVRWLEQEIKSERTGEPHEADDLYHTGIVVDDLDAAMDWFTKAAGYRWTRAVDVEQVVTPDGEITMPMRIAYSGRRTTARVLQTIPGTVWVPANSGVHHLGYWSDDVESDSPCWRAGAWR